MAADGEISVNTTNLEGYITKLDTLRQNQGFDKSLAAVESHDFALSCGDLVGEVRTLPDELRQIKQQIGILFERTALSLEYARDHFIESDILQ